MWDNRIWTREVLSGFCIRDIALLAMQHTQKPLGTVTNSSKPHTWNYCVHAAATQAAVPYHLILNSHQPLNCIHTSPPLTFLPLSPLVFPIKKPANLTLTTDLFLIYQLTMAWYVEAFWSPYQLFHQTFTIDRTASIVSYQSCVMYTTVGNSVLSFATSDLNY